ICYPARCRREVRAQLGRNRHRISRMLTSSRPALAAAAIVAGLVAALATPMAQSQNPFGVPSADQPQPGAAIKAVPGSRAQGWLSPGRSEVLAPERTVATQRSCDA